MCVRKKGCGFWLVGLMLCLFSPPVFASGFDGAELSMWWGIPFAGTLLSIALVPVFAPIFWDHHFGKVIAAWAFVFVLPFTWVFGAGVVWENVVHVLVMEYIPFILLLLALYTVAGGIFVQMQWRATPRDNVAFLALGAALASVMGTTGASMLLIRPLLQVNRHRQYRSHIVVFFIFIVSNIGGALTPLGDPPLFLGFLKGVGFFWTLQNLWSQMLFLIVALLGIFYVMDVFFAKREGVQPQESEHVQKGFVISGQQNFILLVGVIGLVLLSGFWSSDQGVSMAGTLVAWPNLVRDVGLLVIVVISMLITARSVRRSNNFSWRPMKEVAKLFAGIFLTIIPVIAMLQAGHKGAFSSVVALVTDSNGGSIPAMYFWVTGLLSSFLDNAPTYLAFFNTAGGNAQVLMSVMAPTLMAISAGAVFMGANTYIGNAPNLMVKAIAEERGVCMPGFLGYMTWSFGILVPLFIVITWIWYL